MSFAVIFPSFTFLTAPNLSVARYPVLYRREGVYAHRTPRMKFLCANAEFGAKAKLAAVRKTG
jgi:hypothetical protein